MPSIVISLTPYLHWNQYLFVKILIFQTKITNGFSSLNCLFSIIFVIIFMMSLDAVKTKSKLEKIEPKNNVIPVQIKPKYENKIESKQWFWQSA